MLVTVEASFPRLRTEVTTEATSVTREPTGPPS